VAWGVPHVFSELLSQILGQAVGWGADGADDGPERGTYTLLPDCIVPQPRRQPSSYSPL
jgi:hypothetical protein